MLHLEDSWVWDFWTADTGEEYHLFFLFASRALHDPDRRHRRASIGHAVSRDLIEWRRVADALVPGEASDFDSVATWTGSVIQAPDGSWQMYYTGTHDAPGGFVQQVALATSTDLMTWHKAPEPIVSADARWYETIIGTEWTDEAWRDPWVFRDPDGDGWHMLVTARADHGGHFDRGVVGHATSADLAEWTVQPPLSTPDGGFGQLEVLQVEDVDGMPVLLFSCLVGEMSAERAGSATGGVWAVAAQSMTGPFDIARAVPLTDDSLYSGRLVKSRAGEWMMLAFHANSAEGFVGNISDPIPLTEQPWGEVRATGQPRASDARESSRR